MRLKISRAALQGLSNLALIALTLFVYWRVQHFWFVDYDDYDFIHKNAHVIGGLNAENILWAFTSTFKGNWYPLVWLTYMLDYTLSGLSAYGYHLTNLALHVLAVLLLFRLLERVTGSVWRSAFVAAVFAAHPLHVESVAWIAERKDVLSALFWMLTMLAYVNYTQKPEARKYLLVILAFACGLMSKPMLVTLPLALLLFDYWPLDRKQPFGKLLLEKTPLFLMAAAASVVAYWAQRQEGRRICWVICP